MKRILLAIAFVALTLGANAQINDIPRSTPEEQGVPSKALIELFDAMHNMEQTDIHSMIVMRHGKVVGEFYPAPFAPEYQHTQYSSSKTLVSLAAGIAIDENRLRLTDRVATFFPEYLPDSICTNLADMTVRDLLTMQSGIKPDWGMRAKTTEWIKTFLGKPVPNKPGEVFAYDSMVTYMISAIVQKVTGKTVLEYLKEKMFNHMGVTVVNWEESPEGINTGGWGLHIQSESLAKVGQMWLDGGVWNGKQIVSKEWIEQMSAKQANGGDYGYGYQVWMCKYPSAVRADGALGQYVIVVPEKDVVIVLTEASFTNGKPQRNLIWDNFLPQLVDEPLPASKDYQTLLAKQASYTLEIPAGKDKSSVMKKLAGKKISVPKNKYGWKEVVFEQGADKQLLMHLTKTDGTTYTQPMGYKKWSTCEIAGLPPYSINPIDWHRGLEGPFYGAACYGWEKNVLNANIHYVNWVTSLYTTWEVKDGEIILSISNNYAKNKVEKFTCKVE
ncbi:MAG: serine hydrolase [Bacteroidales bacterium]|nr:serine hydrolase [Bacteroidales bacterium]